MAVPTYVTLFNWTDQGIKGYKDTVARAAEAEASMAKLGITLKEIYWTQGPYDIVAVTEAPDEETSTAFLLALGAQGNVRTTTLRAWNRDEMARIVAKLG
jgi:uncharacterized protein with GYD domain